MTIQFHIKTLCTSLDAFQIYKLVAKGEDYIFLDSSKKELPYGGYSIIGINPFLTVKYENNCIYEKTSGEFFFPLGKYKNIFNRLFLSVISIYLHTVHYPVTVILLYIQCPYTLRNALLCA